MISTTWFWNWSAWGLFHFSIESPFWLDEWHKKGGATEPVGASGCLWPDWHAPHTQVDPKPSRTPLDTSPVTRSALWQTADCVLILSDVLHVRPGHDLCLQLNFLTFLRRCRRQSQGIRIHTWPGELAKRNAVQISSFSATLGSRAR